MSFWFWQVTINVTVLPSNFLALASRYLVTFTLMKTRGQRIQQFKEKDMDFWWRKLHFFISKSLLLRVYTEALIFNSRHEFKNIYIGRPGILTIRPISENCAQIKLLCSIDGIEIFLQFFWKLISNIWNIAWVCGKTFQN